MKKVVLIIFSIVVLSSTLFGCTSINEAVNQKFFYNDIAPEKEEDSSIEVSIDGNNNTVTVEVVEQYPIDYTEFAEIGAPYMMAEDILKLVSSVEELEDASYVECYTANGFEKRSSRIDYKIDVDDVFFKEYSLVIYSYIRQYKDDYEPALTCDNLTLYFDNVRISHVGENREPKRMVSYIALLKVAKKDIPFVTSIDTRYKVYAKYDI